MINPQNNKILIGMVHATKKVMRGLFLIMIISLPLQNWGNSPMLKASVEATFHSIPKVFGTYKLTGLKSLTRPPASKTQITATKSLITLAIKRDSLFLVHTGGGSLEREIRVMKLKVKKQKRLRQGQIEDHQSIQQLLNWFPQMKKLDTISRVEFKCKTQKRQMKCLFEFNLQPTKEIASN